jgi:hypothetical protein
MKSFIFIFCTMLSVSLFAQQTDNAPLTKDATTYSTYFVQGAYADMMAKSIMHRLDVYQRSVEYIENIKNDPNTSEGTKALSKIVTPEMLTNMILEAEKPESK